MLRSYCTCGWSDLDDDNDSNFNGHVFGDFSSAHRMCSLGEWNLCKEIFEKDNIINNLESQLESNCSEEVILLREKVMHLENLESKCNKEVILLREKVMVLENQMQEKLYANKKDGPGPQESNAGSRLSRRRARG